MKEILVILLLLISLKLFGQLDKVSQIQVNDSTILINDSIVFSYPMNVEDLVSIFGKARLSRGSSNSSNQVYFWDKLGIMAFTENGKKEITSFEICLSRSSIGPSTKRKFHGILIINNSVITKNTNIDEFKLIGYNVDKPDSILPSWHSLILERLKIIAETERNDKRTTGIGISKRT